MKTSIIIPVRFRAELTKVCLDSIIKYTKVPYELIVVQEGEEKDISKLLKKYPKIKTAQNKMPKGFAGAMNTGLDLADPKTDYYCFLNNDVVAVPGWLEEQLKAFKNKEVGLVTPTFGATESIQHVDYNKGQVFDYIDEPLNLMGVCFTISKECMDKVGVWDERFGLGGGDDNDMATRVQQAGYKLVISRKAYIYHYGSASFRELFNNDAKKSHEFADKQFKKFKEKHNIKDNPKVFIGIPTLTGFVQWELTTRLIQWTHLQGISVKLQFYSNLIPHDSARNQIVKDFLETDCTHCMMIDDDIVPPINALTELLKADKDIISPLCFTMKPGDDGIPFPMIVAHRYSQKLGQEKEYQPYYGNGIEEVDAMTGGCFLIKRKVYEAIERPYYFQYHKNGVAIYSEDFTFCQQAQALGYKLYTDFRLHCRHLKIVDIKGINDLMAKYGR